MCLFDLCCGRLCELFERTSRLSDRIIRDSLAVVQLLIDAPNRVITEVSLDKQLDNTPSGTDIVLLRETLLRQHRLEHRFEIDTALLAGIYEHGIARSCGRCECCCRDAFFGCAVTLSYADPQIVRWVHHQEPDQKYDRCHGHRDRLIEVDPIGDHADTVEERDQKSEEQQEEAPKIVIEEISETHRKLSRKALLASFDVARAYLGGARDVQVDAVIESRCSDYHRVILSCRTETNMTRSVNMRTILYLYKICNVWSNWWNNTSVSGTIEVMKFQLVTLLGVKVDKDVYEVVLPTKDGEIAVFPGHEPLVSIATPGAIAVRHARGDADDKLEYFAISGGVIEVRQDSLRVLVDEADSGEDIVEAESKAALERALKAQSEAKNQVELEQATALVDRHAVRLKVADLRRRHRP